MSRDLNMMEKKKTVRKIILYAENILAHHLGTWFMYSLRLSYRKSCMFKMLLAVGIDI